MNETLNLARRSIQLMFSNIKVNKLKVISENVHPEEMSINPVEFILSIEGSHLSFSCSHKGVIPPLSHADSQSPVWASV